jgi:hypothetical protein
MREIEKNSRGSPWRWLRGNLEGEIIVGDSTCDELEPEFVGSRRPTMGWENAGIYEAKVNFGGEWKDDCVQAALPTTPPEEHGRNTPSYIRQRWPTSPWNLSKRRCCSKKVRRGPVRTHGSAFLAPLWYRETLSGRRSPQHP